MPMPQTSMLQTLLRTRRCWLPSVLLVLAACGDGGPAAAPAGAEPAQRSAIDTSALNGAQRVVEAQGTPPAAAAEPRELERADMIAQRQANALAQKHLLETYGINVSVEVLATPTGLSLRVELSAEQDQNLRRNMLAIGPALEQAKERFVEMRQMWHKLLTEDDDSSAAAVVSTIQQKGARTRTIVEQPKAAISPGDDPALHNPFGVDRLPRKPVTRRETLPEAKAAEFVKELLTLWRTINKDDMSAWPEPPLREPQLILRHLDAGKLTVGDLLDAEDARNKLPQLATCLQEKGAQFRRLKELIIVLGYGETVRDDEEGGVPRPADEGYKLPPAILKMEIGLREEAIQQASIRRLGPKEVERLQAELKSLRDHGRLVR